MDQNIGDIPEAVQMWRSLRDYIKLDIDVHAPESPGPNSPVNITLTVSNTAPSEPDWPEVEFEDVSISVKRQGGSSESISGGRLSSGRSVKNDFECTYEELPGIELEVAGTVARSKFFRTHSVTRVPTEYSRPSALAFVSQFNELDLHGPLESATEALQGLSPSTTLAELQSRARTLADTEAATESLQQKLNDVSRSASGASYTAHIKLAYSYLTAVRDSGVAVRDALASADEEKTETAKSALFGLAERVAEVNEATEALMARYDLAESEVGYRNRQSGVQD